MDKEALVKEILQEVESRLKSRSMASSPVFIREMSLLTFTSLAQGIPLTKEAEEILDRLLRGETITVLRSALPHQRFIKTMPKNLLNLYRQYEKNLCLFGITVEEEGNTDLYRHEESFSAPLRKKLITEKTLMEGNFLGGTVVIPKNSIVTPLAEDYIKTHHLTVIRGGVTCG